MIEPITPGEALRHGAGGILFALSAIWVIERVRDWWRERRETRVDRMRDGGGW